MEIILNIDTSSRDASLNIAISGKVVYQATNSDQKDHAGWIQPAIQAAVVSAGLQLRDLSAVGLTSGPGSYTGLRVGLATAKGLCYALGIPLVTLNTLLVLAASAVEEDEELLCPMIDARRMEVYTAIYDKSLTPRLSPGAMLIDENAFSEWLSSHTMLFFGDGQGKWESICRHPRARFRQIPFDTACFARLTHQEFLQSSFADLAYAEPEYLKEFYKP